MATPISAACQLTAPGSWTRPASRTCLGRANPSSPGWLDRRRCSTPLGLRCSGATRESKTEAGQAFLADKGVSFTEGPELAADPAGTARRALAALAPSTGPVVVHFDVDVVDSGDLPLGNYPHYGSGVLLEHVTAALRVLLADPACAGLVLTEVNPSYDADGGQLERYVTGS